MHPIYERISDLCKANGTSISKLCNDVTGSLGNTSTWKKGNVRNDYLIEIAERLNVSADYILGRTDDPSPQPLEVPEILQEVWAAFNRKGIDNLSQKQIDKITEYTEFVLSQPD